MNIKITLILSITIGLGMYNATELYAQQESQFTQYMYNTMLINPAYAGNRETLSITSLYRTQWTGIDGAPRTLSLSADSPLGTRGLGLGLSILQDEIGPAEETGLGVNFSYTINLNEYAKLSFGLKTGLNILNVDFGELEYEPQDPNAINVNETSPVFGAGLYLYSKDKGNDDRWYVGISSPNFMTTKHYDDHTESTATEEAHINLMGGYVFDLNDNLKFKPATLIKAVLGAPVAVDVSANFLINQRATLGVAYRWESAVSALAAFQVSESFMIGYAYDYDTSDFNNRYHSGSHEVFLRFEFATRLKKIVNPRFF